MGMPTRGKNTTMRIQARDESDDRGPRMMICTTTASRRHRSRARRNAGHQEENHSIPLIVRCPWASVQGYW